MTTLQITGLNDLKLLYVQVTRKKFFNKISIFPPCFGNDGCKRNALSLSTKNYDNVLHTAPITLSALDNSEDLFFQCS